LFVTSFGSIIVVICARKQFRDRKTPDALF
jgi:hypothetical protein